ncbi:MAG: hypothetical protein UX98_C0009G0014 [Parcubacteria group bacterium GW2011_GWA2_47_26]|nr:MAG: hypothetical protein UX98_C0009G0014 [Parcubacteria group bacterium GW2011_GWA2_47_26]
MLNPNYVTGLTDGEGTFTYSRMSKVRNLSLYYAIALNIKDLELLKKVREFFGCGKIYFSKPVAGKFSNPKSISGARAYFRIVKIAELFKVTRHFEEYPLQGEKAKAFVIWKRMVEFKARMYRHEMPKLLALAAELSKMNGRIEKRKLILEQNKIKSVDQIPLFQFDHDSRYYDPTA